MNPDPFDKVHAIFDRVLAECGALRQERDAALLALSALCESCGGPEPHTLEHCTAHLQQILTALRPPEAPK